MTTQTGTAWGDLGDIPLAANDFRFNYSSTDASSSYYLDNFGGAVPLGRCHSRVRLQPRMGVSLFMYARSETTQPSMQGQMRTTSNGKSISWTAYPYKKARIA